MIYEFPDPDQAIRQGDIFRSLPQVLVDPEKLIVVEDDKPLAEPRSWIGEADKKQINALAKIEPAVCVKDIETTS